jgi:hypothetical protein
MTSQAVFCKRNLIAAAITVGQFFAMSPVLAADGSVRIAGQTVFENKVASGGMSVEQRAETIQRNLDNALVAAKDRSPSAVSIVYVKGVPVITLGGYQVVTVDGDNARLSGTTPAVLAGKWADALKKSLADQPSVDSYVAQLTGSYPGSNNSPNAAPPATAYAPSQAQPQYQPPANQPPPNYGGGNYGGNGGSGYAQPAQYSQSDQYSRNTTPVYGQPPMQRGRVIYAPQGLVIPASLDISISTQAAQSGDFIQASISQPVFLGDSQIPAGSKLIGQVTEAKGGGFLGRAGTLGIKFNRLRTPDGVETPITAHIQGGIGKYGDKGGDGSDVFKGETWKTKAGQAAIRGGIGAGAGAALGTAVGAIAGGGRGVGRGAWSGTAIGAGVGVADSLFLRKGKDVVISSGSPIQVQLDAPMSISIGGNAPYSGAF